MQAYGINMYNALLYHLAQRHVTYKTRKIFLWQCADRNQSGIHVPRRTKRYSLVSEVQQVRHTRRF